MSAAAIPHHDAVALALEILAGLERVRSCEQTLLATAAGRAHATLARALANLAPEDLDMIQARA